MRRRREVVRGGVRRDRVVAWIRRGRDRIEEVSHIIVRGRICVGVVGGRAHSSGDAAKIWMRLMVCCESVETEMMSMVVVVVVMMMIQVMMMSEERSSSATGLIGPVEWTRRLLKGLAIAWASLPLSPSESSRLIVALDSRESDHVIEFLHSADLAALRL